MIYYFYKIVCDDLPDYLYVGSTRAYTNRKYRHKSNCNNENCKHYNLKIYQTIRANGGWDNWKMICIHQQDIENNRMAEKIEENFRLDLKANMNMCRAYRSEEDKKEYKKEYCKEWRENNSDYIKEQAKEYYQNNKEYKKEKHKEYYENNREHIKQQYSKKYECECGCQIRLGDLARHKRSQKHIKLMQNI